MIQRVKVTVPEVRRPVAERLRYPYWELILPYVQPGATLPGILPALARSTLAAIPDRSAVAVGRPTYTLAWKTSPSVKARISRLLTPELMPDEIFYAAFAALSKKT